MEALFALLLIALLLAAPVAALVWAINAHKRIKDLTERLTNLEQGAPPPPAPPMSSPVATATDVAGTPPRTEAAAPQATGVTRLTAGVEAPPPVLPPVMETPERPGPAPDLEAAAPDAEAKAWNWEQFMGVKLAAWLGGLALFLALAFLIKYSFEHDLIPPAVRVGLGYLAGLALVAGGIQITQRNYAVTGQTLSATGIVTLYAITFAAHAIYSFPAFSTLVTMLIMVLVTAGAFLLANAQRAQVIALLGMLGGFLTPILLSTGRDNAAGLFLYLAILDLGLIAIAGRRNWTHLILLGAIGTAILQAGWFNTHYDTTKLPTLVIVSSGFIALFGLAHARLSRMVLRQDFIAWAAVVPALMAFGFAIPLVQHFVTAWKPQWVLALLLAAAVGALAALLLNRRHSKFHPVVGLASFYVLGLWLSGSHVDSQLAWSIGAILVFAGLHSAVPFVRHRFEHEDPELPWAGIFPLVGLVALLPVVFAGAAATPWVWPAATALVVLAFVRALMMRSLAPLVFVLVGGMIVLGAAITRIAPGTAGSFLELVLVVMLGIGFVSATVAVLNRIRSDHPGSSVPLPRWAEHMPGVSATAPFLLLAFLVTRIRPDSVAPLFLAAVALAALLFVLAFWQRRGALCVAALAGVLLVEHAVHFGDILSVSPTARLAWHLGIAVLFVGLPFALRARMLPLQGAVATAALSFPGHLFLIVTTAKFALPGVEPGLVAVSLALPAIAGMWIVTRTVSSEEPWRLNRLAWLGASALFCITVAIPLQYSHQWLTLGWALEGAALIALFRKLPHPGLRIGGVVLLCVVFVRLALNEEVLRYGVRGELPIFNWILATYGTAALACFLGAAWIRPSDARVLGVVARPLLAALGAILAFLLLNLQIADYFTPWGRPLELSFSGIFSRDMAYTIGWAVFALLLLLAGIRLKARHARYASLALLGAALLKLFFHDLLELNQLYRIGALVAVAVVAIVSSWLYQRFLRDDSTG